MLRLEAEVCIFSRNKLYRRYFSRKVLKAEKAFYLLSKLFENTFEMTAVEFFFPKVGGST